MSALHNRIRKAREFKREIEGWSLTLRRPTDQEAGRIFRGEGRDPVEVATTFVIDWHGVTEADLVVSGGSHEVAFDRDVWREVVADRPELWEPISQAVTEAWVEWNNGRDDRAKKS